MADFHLKISDTLPILEATLLEADGSKINVSAATSVTFRMRVKQLDPFIDILCVVIDDGTPALRGRVDVPWTVTADSTTTAGFYKALFKVLFPGPLTLSVPNKGCKTIEIENDC